MPSGACVLRYEGARGVVWRVKYRDAEGRQVQETIGAERDGVTRKQAEAELRERLVRVERRGYRRPGPLTFGQWADTWLEEGERRRGWKPATVLVYRNALKHLRETFGSMRLGSIRPRDVSAYREQALGEFSAKSVSLHLNVLHDVALTGLRRSELVPRRERARLRSAAPPPPTSTPPRGAFPRLSWKVRTRPSRFMRRPRPLAPLASFDPRFG
jgi:hypothetical protein